MLYWLALIALSSMMGSPAPGHALHVQRPLTSQGSSVDVYPTMDLVHEVDAHPGGTTFIIHPGIYRLESRIKPKDGDAFLGPCGKPPCSRSAQAILTGARQLTSFQQSGPHYSLGGQKQHNPITVDSRKCDEAFPRCGYPEDLYIDDKPLVHAPALDSLGPGKWFFDYPNNTLYFDDNPEGHKVETSVTPGAFTPGPANHVTVKGLTIEKFATPIMTGAVGGAWTGPPSSTAGVNWVVENNEIRLNHADGIRINFGWRVLNNYIHDNGDFGIGGGLGGMIDPEGLGRLPSGVVIQGNEIAFNNYAHVRTGFGAGGVKILGSRGVVFRGNYVHDNLGPGLWTDTNNYDTLYDNNTVTNNTDGIAHEVSYASVVRNNRLLKNGYTMSSEKHWLYAANLFSSTSQGLEAYCNTVEVSSEGGNGMDMVAQPRSSNENRLSTNNYFHHNTVIFDGDSGITGGAWAPKSLESSFVNNRFDYNAYYLADLSRKAFAWNNRFNTFAQFQAAGQEVHGTAASLKPASIPAVVIISPLDESRVSGVVEIRGEAHDSGSSITKVELYVDWARQASVADNPFSFSWNASQLSSGPHVVAAMVYNKEGVHTCYALTLDAQP